MIVDKLGHCVKCGNDLITEKFLEGEIRKVLVPEYDQIQFELNDASKMRVVMCKPCKAILKDSDHTTIMKSVIAGWEKEVKENKTWDAKKKNEHMKVYKKKKITKRVKEFKHGSHR